MSKKNERKEDAQPVKEELALVGEIPAVRLKAPKGATAVSVAGEQYEVEEDDTVVVPADLATELRSHGYTEAE